MDSTTSTRSSRALVQVAKQVENIRDVAGVVLILNNSNLQEVPDVVVYDDYCREYLRELCLKNNQIKLMNGIEKFKMLSKLYLPSNSLKELPDELAALPSLTLVDVSSNHITYIPPSVAKMKHLQELNIGNNLLKHLPDGLWKVSKLEKLNAQGNQLQNISSEIVHCQSLVRLILDCNLISNLPVQVTKLRNLKYLSLSGNDLKLLPSGLVLESLLVDMNPSLSCIPVSLASTSWWGTLGAEGCPVHIHEEMLNFLKPLNTCTRIPSLTEITARFLHMYLKDSLRDNLVLWLPKKLCFMLQLPSGLEDWLIPSGKCSFRLCRGAYFKHHYSMRTSGFFYKMLTAGVCKPNSLALSIDCCSTQCAMYYFTAF